MPRPLLLPIIDWPAVFASALTWEAWLEAEEKPEYRDALRQARRDLAAEIEIAAAMAP